MLKRFTTISMLLLAAGMAHATDAPLCGQENTAACLLRLTGPVPSIDSPVECDTADQTIVYTVFNDSDEDVNLAPAIVTDGDDTSSGSSVTIDTNPLNSSCYETSPPSVPAEDFCTITVTIDIVDCIPTDFPEFIVRELVVVLDFPQAPLTADIDVEITGPVFLTALPGVYTTTLKDSLATNHPLLAAYTANTTWENIDTSVFFNDGEFKSATCTGTDATGICIAVGGGHESTVVGGSLTAPPDPIILASQNGGLIWDVPFSTDPLPQGVLNSVACSDTGSSAQCIAVGAPNNPGDAIAMRSFDGGVNWASYNLSSIGNGYLVDVACSDLNSPSGICAGVGQFTAFGGVLLTFGDVKTAKMQIHSTFKANTIVFNATDCAGDGSDLACTAVGTSPGFAELYMLFEPGPTFVSWSTIVDGEFYDTACSTALSGNLVCTAVGKTTIAGNSMLYINPDMNNAPNAWTVVTTATTAQLNGAACQTNASKTVCVAAGQDGANSLLYINTDVITDPFTGWTLVSSPNNAHFNGAACSLTTQGKVTCTAAGETASGAPLFYTNPDVHAYPWGTPSVPALPSPGCFNGAGAAGANSNNAGC